MTENQWKNYTRRGVIEARPYVQSDLDDKRISIGAEDMRRPTLKGGMVARNPDNPCDMWYVNPEYFAQRYMETAKTPDSAPLDELWVLMDDSETGRTGEVTFSADSWREILCVFWRSGFREQLEAFGWSPTTKEPK